MIANFIWNGKWPRIISPHQKEGRANLSISDVITKYDATLILNWMVLKKINRLINKIEYGAPETYNDSEMSYQT